MKHNDDNLTTALRLLRNYVDENLCQFDHDGDCQMHGFFGLEPGEICPNEEAKQLLQRVDAEQEAESQEQETAVQQYQAVLKVEDKNLRKPLHIPYQTVAAANEAAESLHGARDIWFEGSFLFNPTARVGEVSPSTE